MADEPQLPPEVQQQLMQLQNLSAQLQSVSQQRAQLEAMKHETDEAVAALDALPDESPVYRSLGTLLVKEKGKPEALARLREQAETLEIRIKRVRSQEEQVRKSAQQLQQSLQKTLQG